MRGARASEVARISEAGREVGVARSARGPEKGTWLSELEKHYKFYRKLKRMYRRLLREG